MSRELCQSVCLANSIAKWNVALSILKLVSSASTSEKTDDTLNLSSEQSSVKSNLETENYKNVVSKQISKQSENSTILSEKTEEPIFWQTVLADFRSTKANDERSPK